MPATGVEMAGHIAELARDTLERDFRSSDPRPGRILLGEAADRVLTAFPESLSGRAERSLRQLGVTPLLDSMVVDVDASCVTIEKDSERKQIPTHTVIWAAGVAASSLAGKLAELTGAETDKAGRVTVSTDLSLAGHPEVFAVGDMVRPRGPDGEPITLPCVAPVAMQQGHYVAKVVRPGSRAARSSRSATSTRATWQRSAAPPPSPTSRGSSSVARSRGSPGW